MMWFFTKGLCQNYTIDKHQYREKLYDNVV